MTLETAAQQRILVLDGAMGTRIQQYNLTEADFHGYAFLTKTAVLKGNNDVLNITRPDIVEDIHSKWKMKAGGWPWRVPGLPGGQPTVFPPPSGQDLYAVRWVPPTRPVR